jgi:hypothetical protein
VKERRVEASLRWGRTGYKITCKNKSEGREVGINMDVRKKNRINCREIKEIYK